MEVYVERAHSLWKEPEVIQWFRECIPTAVARLRDQGDARAQQLSADARALGAYHMVDFPTGVLRHVFLSDLKSASSSGNNGPALSLERFIPARYKTGSQSLTPWGAPQLTFLDPLPPTFIPRDVPTAAIGTALRSPIDPYDRYHRRQLVRRHPHEAVPIVAERIGEDADEERRLGVSRYELREAAGVSGLTMGGGVLATLLQSLLPWTSVGAGASSGGNGDGPLDVPGMQAFLRGDLREQKS